MKSTERLFTRNPGGRKHFPGPLCLLAAIVVTLAVGSSKPALAATGDLDLSFGVGGTVTTIIGDPGGTAFALVLQPDGKLVAAGMCNDNFCLARYNPDGTLDTSFGVGGTVTTIDNRGKALALVLQPDGKLVTAGHFCTGGFCLARHNPDGSLDASFGGGGTVTTAIGSSAGAWALVLQPDGKLVAAGQCSIGDTGGFCLARYNPDGSLDASFGGGTVTTAIGSYAGAWALVLQPDGKLVAAGGCIIGDTGGFCLARYNLDGTLDAGFGVGGTVITAIDDPQAEAFALVLQPDGKLVAAGECVINDTNDFCLVRYNPDGTLDAGFGVGGKVETAIGSGANAYALVLESDGKLVAAGRCMIGGTLHFCLARYSPDGSLDAGFGVDGKVTTTIGSHAEAYALVLQPDGKLVAAGWCAIDNTAGFCLARYLGDVTELTLPFPVGEMWYVCQGYNGPISHRGVAALDLSIDAESFAGRRGCSPDTHDASTGKVVLAPAVGTVKAHIKNEGEEDMLCLELEGLAMMKIGHLTDMLSVGATFKRDDALGRVAGPSRGNGDYAHIHVQLQDLSAGCRKAETIPFSGQYRLEDAPDMPYDDNGTPNKPSDDPQNQWRGTVLTRTR